MSQWGPLADVVPWDALRHEYRVFRATYFSAPRPEGTYLRVKQDPQGVEAALGKQSFAPNWEQSYYERGEVVNQARIVYRHEKQFPAYQWWQTHVRGWPSADGEYVLLRGHWELEPTENDKAHIDGVGFDQARGMANLKGALDQAGVGYKEVTWNLASGQA